MRYKIRDLAALGLDFVAVDVKSFSSSSSLLSLTLVSESLKESSSSSLELEEATKRSKYE